MAEEKKTVKKDGEHSFVADQLNWEQVMHIFK